MADWTKDMHGICEKLTEEISEMNKKMDKNGGKMSAGDLEALDKLTHALKSVKTTLAMEEYDDERSGDYMGGSYERGEIVAVIVDLTSRAEVMQEVAADMQSVTAWGVIAPNTATAGMKLWTIWQTIFAKLCRPCQNR